ncbi:MAG: YmdB family metallophosphoesterase [Lawsonibacter sp.]|nr:YmdB family metallophosphoesterase [Lawsonibacter sp.]
MLLQVLAVGDIVGEGGQDILARRLGELRREHGIHFTVVNGENASGVGITPRQSRGILEAGADVITLGNHTWNRLQIGDFLDREPRILRPANYAGRVPGRGLGVYEGPGGVRIAVLNLMGRLELDSNLDSPFKTADSLLRSARYDIAVVDFHAEATSEKGAMAWYLDGRVQAVWGTHTHVPTADGQVLPKGTGFVTDLGMTGPSRSVLGIRPEHSVNRFLGGLPRRYEEAEGNCKLNACRFTIDTEKKRCVEVRRVDIQE